MVAITNGEVMTITRPAEIIGVADRGWAAWRQARTPTPLHHMYVAASSSADTPSTTAP
jgi:hypothetical protein